VHWLGSYGRGKSSALSSGWAGCLWVGIGKRVGSFGIGGDGINFNGFKNSATACIGTPRKRHLCWFAYSRNNPFVKRTLNLHP